MTAPAARTSRRTRPNGGAVEVTVRPIEQRAFYTPRTLAERLAVSPRTVRDMLARRVIASYLVEGSRRIDPADVDAYLAQRRVGEA